MSDARAYAQRNQRGSDWFSHDATATATPAAPKPAPPPAAEQKTDDSAQSGRTQMIKPKCESNNWFKHEHTAGSEPAPAVEAPAPAASAPPAAAPTAAAPPAAENTKAQQEGDANARRDKAGSSGFWFSPAAAPTPAAPEPSVAAASAAPTAAAPPAAENTKAQQEGDANARRDKAGSSASWFSHDHQKATAAHGPRVTTKEGGANASRMRGESEQWFNYDNSKGQQDVHVGKARSAKPQGDSMSQIFNQGN